jgi:hypothetical protein
MHLEYPTSAIDFKFDYNESHTSCKTDLEN